MRTTDRTALVEFVADLRARIGPHLSSSDLEQHLDPDGFSSSRHLVATLIVMSNLLSRYGPGSVHLLMAEAPSGPREVLRVQTVKSAFDIDLAVDASVSEPILVGPAGSLYENTYRIEQPFFLSADIYTAIVTLAKAAQVDY